MLINSAELTQGSPEWLAARAGHVSASVFKDLLAKGRSGESSSRRNLRMKLVTERLIGAPVESYKNAAMEYGNATEPLACAAYEAYTGSFVEHAGFIKHPTLKWVGGSPDGVVDSDGGFEAKCPYVSTVHVETLMGGGIPPEHVAQCQGLMWILNRQWWDFVSFDPRMPEHLQLYVYRVPRDDAYIANLEAEVIRFLVEIQTSYNALMGRSLAAQEAT